MLKSVDDDKISEDMLMELSDMLEGKNPDSEVKTMRVKMVRHLVDVIMT